MSVGLVSLVGAGPGHPGLLTLRGQECLREADLILYDKLVPKLLLRHARPEAEAICITELAPTHRQRHQPIHEKMIEAARAGKRVVRLKGGDPFIFGRGGEEAEVLHEAGIPFEIIPGVTCALGAAAFAGIPLTHRDHSSAVAFITGVENPSKADATLDWHALARFPGTLAIYMGLSRLERITSLLLANGKDPATPAAVIHWATTGEQQTVSAPLSELTDLVRREGLVPPAIVLVGAVVALRGGLSWFERAPLLGKRVLVTRPRHQANDFIDRLIGLGAVPYLLPAVEIREPADWSPVDDAIAQLMHFHWLVFTSANGVRMFIERLRSLGRDLRALGNVSLAAIGPKTADALRSFHLDPELVPTRYQSEDLAQALKEAILPGQRVLLARADRGRDVLREKLQAHAEVVQIAVYSQVDAVADDQEVWDLLRRGEIDYLTLTSSNIAKAVLTKADDAIRLRLMRGEPGLVSISPITSAEIKRLGFPVAGEATEATVDGIVQVLCELAQQGERRT